MKNKKTSKKIGFWYICFLFCVLVMVNPHEARSNSFVDSLKGFFSSDKEQTSKKETTPVKNNIENSAATEPAQVESRESQEVEIEVAASSGQGVIKSEADLLARLVEEPDNPTYLFELGQMKLLQGEIAIARVHFEKIQTVSNNPNLALVGLTLTELLIGNWNKAYSTITSVPTLQDPTVLLLRYYCEFLLGREGAENGIIENASKVENFRLSSGILAGFYALVGDYNIANANLNKLEKTGFLYPQALIAKYLSSPEVGENVFSDYRNKYQLNSAMAHLIIGNAQMLSFDYEKARKSFTAAKEGASSQIKEIVAARLKQLNDVNDKLLLGLHRQILVHALERKNKSLLQKNIMGKEEALIRLLYHKQPSAEMSNKIVEAFSSNNPSGLDVKSFNAFLIDTITSNYFYDQAKKVKGNSEDKRNVGRFTNRLWSYYMFQMGNPPPEEEVVSVMKRVIKSQEEFDQPYTVLAGTFIFYFNSKLSAQDFDSIRKIYKDKQSVYDFMQKFYDTSHFAKLEDQEMLNQVFNDYLAGVQNAISTITSSVKNMKEQNDGLILLNSFRNDQSLTFEKAQSRLGELEGVGCLKESAAYYLAKRFKKETSKLYQEYLTCLKGLSPEQLSVEQSVGIVIETLYFYKEYAAIIKTFETNGERALQASHFALVHYVDSLGKTNNIDQAKKEAARLCDKVPPNICTQINLEVIPQLELAKRYDGMNEASKILSEVGPLVDKKNYARAKQLLKQAKEFDPVNPYIYMYYEAIYRADKGFDFLAEYTDLVSHFITMRNIETDLKNKIVDRIFKPCADINLPCEILVSLIDDGHFKDVAQEMLQPAYAAQLIRVGLLEKAGKIIDEMAKSSNLTLQRKGIMLKASLTEILKHVEQQGSFNKNMIPETEATSV